MTDWRRHYDARDWQALENWWRHSDDFEELNALFSQLSRDVPKRVLRNGLDEHEEFLDAKNAPVEWMGAAAILEFGELEAKIHRYPASDPEIWEDQEAGLTAELRALVASEEVTEGDDVLSRRAHAERALESLEQVKKTVKFRLGLYSPDEQEALREFAADVAINALRAGYFSHAAESKSIQAHAVRGKTTLASAAAGGRSRARETNSKSKKILKRMRELVKEGGHSVSRAAEIAHKEGQGTSANANRQLWKRNNKE